MDLVIQRYRTEPHNTHIPVNLKCLLCKQILLSPVQTECGCRFCQTCLEKYLSDGPKSCVGDADECRNTIDTFLNDKATVRDIGQLKMVCLNSPCTFEGILKNMSGHFESCQFRKTACLSCGQMYLELEKKKHDDEECIMRDVDCEHCKIRLKFLNLNELHLKFESEELCPKYSAPCPFKCGVSGDVNWYSHQKECKNKPHKCPFHSLGCEKSVSLEQMSDHVSTHSSTVIEEIQTLKSVVTDLSDKVRRLEEEKQQVVSLKVDFERKFAEMEKINKQGPANAVGKTPESVYRKGKYIWKIANFSVLKENASKGIKPTIISNPFYTDDFGYKMCLKIYPYGDGIAKGTHLSVFFVIMRGEFDDLQVWPFKNKVTLAIVDDFSKASSHSDTFKPDARSVCYQQPEEEYNIASGSPRFIPFTELSRLLKHDTLYIQINVLPL